MVRTLTRFSLAASLLAMSAFPMAAQTFVSPNAVEYIFSDPHVTPAEHTSCYSLRAGYAYFPGMASVLGSAYADLYVAGWNSKDIGGTHEVTVLLTESTNPSNILWKVSIPYTDVRDLEVGSLRNTTNNNTNILVAYYKEGAGHMLDIYELDPSGGVNLVDHKVLSHSPTYGRIRMDFHATYDCAIAWVNTEPGVNKGVQAIVYTSNTWSNVSTLSGTAAKTGVDIAITRVTHTTSASGLSYPLHFVYSGGGFVTEASVDMSTLAANPVTVTPAINDNYYVGAGLNSKLVLDCSDFSQSTTAVNGSAWAYTYTDGMNVIVRHRNASLPAANTVVVTSGMLGNNPLDPFGVYKLFSPALNYGLGYPNGSVEKIMVTWYATDGSSVNKYIGLEMDANGTMVTSLPDYLDLPNASSATLPSNFTSGIALSKTGPKSVGEYLYATYYDVDPTTGEYRLHHAFHQWGDVAFRPGGNTVIEAAGTPQVNVYPSPFRDMLTTTVSLPEAGALQLALYDMAGRIVWEQKATLTKGSHEVKAENLKRLTAGTYMFTATLNGKKITSRMIAKQ